MTSPVVLRLTIVFDPSFLRRVQELFRSRDWITLKELG